MSESDTVICVENLSKRYLVGHEGPQERYHSLRDTIVRHGKNFMRKTVDMAKGNQIIQGDTVEEFWALKDVSFEVKRGEVLGIIGRNGAGKSTLLKILSRITEPTGGRVTLRGRVASLLEVGTGFHPELSGRENIFLNGAILGMSRLEIKGKFDEIVDFAGVKRFLDTPVKRYSSGMYVRLAFAVAAHLEPEILIVDEVLAVGDTEFQKKCIGKMKDVAKGGRTVLFVSHNLSAIRQLCSNGLILSNGVLTLNGTVQSAISSYIEQAKNQEVKAGTKLTEAFELVSFECECSPTQSGNDIRFLISLKAMKETVLMAAAVLVYSGAGSRIGVVDCRPEVSAFKMESGKIVMISATVSCCALVEGVYPIGLYLETENGHFDRHGLAELKIGPPLSVVNITEFSPEYLGFMRFKGSVKLNLA
jgi:lipopolysaccharide transport system ATP-binding protein